MAVDVGVDCAKSDSVQGLENCYTPVTGVVMDGLLRGAENFSESAREITIVGIVFIKSIDIVYTKAIDIQRSLRTRPLAAGICHSVSLMTRIKNVNSAADET